MIKDEKNPAAAKAIILALLCAFFIKLFCFDFIFTEGNSMLPAVRSGSVLVINKLAFGLRPPFCKKYILCWDLPHTGDILVFWAPSGELVVKRFVSLTDDGRFSALGDNGPASLDSRSYGPVPIDNILGKAVGIK
jgi:signal peptidase I